MEDITRNGELRLHKNYDMSENVPEGKNSELLGLSGEDVESLSLKTSKDKVSQSFVKSNMARAGCALSHRNG